jgi:hypothetical protein
MANETPPQGAPSWGLIWLSNCISGYIHALLPGVACGGVASNSGALAITDAGLSSTIGPQATRVSRERVRDQHRVILMLIPV